MGAARVGDRAHVGLVAVLHVRIHHVEVALVHRQIDRFANRAARVVQGIGGVGQFHEVLEVFNGGVAPALVDVTHKGRAIGGCKYGVFAANDHVVGGVAGVLGKFTRGAGLHQGAAHATRHAHAFALDVGTGLAPDVQRLGVVTEINAYFFQNGVGVVFDDGQAFFVQHFVVRHLAGDVGHGIATARAAGGAFGFAATGGAAVAGSGCLRGSGGGDDFVHVRLQASARMRTISAAKYRQARAGTIAPMRPALVCERQALGSLRRCSA